jgi:hypothetical protein
VIEMSNAITTRNAHVAIAARQPFKAGALKGTAHPDGTYTVHSYRAQIALYSPEHGWSVNEEKYSPTTSRHQTQVRRAVQGGY